MKKISDVHVRNIMPLRQAESYKGTYGRVLVVGGHAQMGGAAILSASAAVYSGAGLVTTSMDESNKTALFSRLPESMFLPSNDLTQLRKSMCEMDVILIGPGLGRDQEAKSILNTVLESVQSNQFLVIDGDALTLIAENELSLPDAKVILTPHLGEWASISGLSPDKEALELNQAAIEKIGATVILKKHRTEIYFKNDVYQNTAGNPAMATGGMGDTLAGMIAGFLPQFDSAKEAIISAVYLHSKIGDIIGKEMHVALPTQVIMHIPLVMRQYQPTGLPSV